ncbi:DUF6455 family protein [Azospirillum sp. ST 5-10]|uniref:DUF6455 family protein n=1 Tax=unclassified Azospirillum TaxID=2630922 RepID=UPI003F4A6FB1
MFAHSAKRSDLMGAMIRRLDIDVAAVVAAGQTAWLSSAGLICVGCPAADRCRAWLTCGSVATAYREFCPNAAMFDRMRASRQPA